MSFILFGHPLSEANRLKAYILAANLGLPICCCLIIILFFELNKNKIKFKRCLKLSMLHLGLWYKGRVDRSLTSHESRCLGRNSLLHDPVLSIFGYQKWILLKVIEKALFPLLPWLNPRHWVRGLKQEVLAYAFKSQHPGGRGKQL